ncbi:hypothetical protein [Mycolicibacterium diernhoferi]|uniref:hypothetical protein n=1 Tax=Mycolicibacterium diernhoferi TaxID=1801 RepID=UPI00104200B9|nr:hypothetical protein [Mycolicibacterium diernhoferi]QYL23523.1 hypothetical protein K0O62_04095 [Mycolicibacterium diernhoferi]
MSAESRGASVTSCFAAIDDLRLRESPKLVARLDSVPDSNVGEAASSTSVLGSPSPTEPDEVSAGSGSGSGSSAAPSPDSCEDDSEDDSDVLPESDVDPVDPLPLDDDPLLSPSSA